MSAIFYEDQKLGEVFGELLGAYKLMDRVFDYNPVVKLLRVDWEKYNPEMKGDETAFRLEIVNRLAFLIGVSNKVAYGLTYNESVDFIGDGMGNPVSARPCTSAKELYRKLQGIDYNLYSNGGTRFLPDTYGELWKEIQHQLADILIVEG